MRITVKLFSFGKFAALYRSLLVVKVCLLAAVTHSLAANVSWDGGSGIDGNFSTVSNWGSDTAPVNDDSLTFTTVGGTVFGGILSNDLATLTSISGIQFNSDYTGPLIINASGGATLGLNGNAVNNSTATVIDSLHFKNYNTLWNVPTTIASGLNIGFTSVANSAMGIGAITLNGTGQLNSNSIVSNGLYITGTYIGSGFETLRSDGARFTGGSQNGSLQTGFGGIVFQNGSINDVANLFLGASQSSNFAVQGEWNGLDYDPTTVHVTTSFKMYRGFNTSSEINVANGGRLIIDASATMGYNATPGTFNTVRANLGGDGNASNMIEFASPTVNLGAYFYPGGNAQARYGGTQVGGLNLVTHGSVWTLYKTMGIGIDFNGVDGGGWTQKTNAMTVNATGSGTAGVNFSNSRFLDVQSASFTFDSSVSFVNIAAGKTLTKNGAGDFNLNAPATGTGTLLANAGTTNLNNAIFTSNLTIATAGTVNTPVSINPAIFTLDGGTLTGIGIVSATTPFDIRSGSISSTLSGSQALNKSTSGTATLSGANNYTGLTTVTAGRLVINGILSGSSIAVTGGILAGTGSIITNNQSFSVESGGGLDPGNAPDGLTINTGSSELNLANAIDGGNTGALLFTLDTPSTSDRITLTGGTLNIGTGLLGIGDFDFTTLGGFANGTYTLFDGVNAINGTLDSGDLTGMFAGLDVTLSLSGGTDVVLNVVPEPGSISMLLGGFGVLVGIQRRRRNRLNNTPHIEDVCGKIS